MKSIVKKIICGLIALSMIIVTPSVPAAAATEKYYNSSFSGLDGDERNNIPSEYRTKCGSYYYWVGYEGYGTPVSVYSSESDTGVATRECVLDPLTSDNIDGFNILFGQDHIIFGHFTEDYIGVTISIADANGGDIKDLCTITPDGPADIINVIGVYDGYVFFSTGIYRNNEPSDYIYKVSLNGGKPEKIPGKVHVAEVVSNGYSRYIGVACGENYDIDSYTAYKIVDLKTGKSKKIKGSYVGATSKNSYSVLYKNGKCLLYEGKLNGSSQKKIASLKNASGGYVAGCIVDNKFVYQVNFEKYYSLNLKTKKTSSISASDYKQINSKITRVYTP